MTIDPKEYVSRHAIRNAEVRDNPLPEITLLPVVEYNGKKLDATDFYIESFGDYRSHLVRMSMRYFHSKKFPDISFRPATTQESIVILSNGIGEGVQGGHRYLFLDTLDMIRPEIPLFLGNTVETQDGVYTNVRTTNENDLKSLLNGAEKVNGIYLNNGVAFAPQESFQKGLQEAGKYAEGGLARALEYTPEKVAKNFKKISSFFIRGVFVEDNYFAGEPFLGVPALDLKHDHKNYGYALRVNLSKGFANESWSFGIVKD